MIRRGLWALAAWVCLAPRAEASISVIYVPEQAVAVAGARSSDLRGLPGVMAAEPVFGAGERDYLRTQGEGRIAGAVRLTLEDASVLEALKARKDLHGRFNLNPVARLQGVNPEQWGLNNTGKPQEVTITDIVSRMIQSVAGEDAGVLHAPAAPAGKKVLVAVIDTGVEMTHPALASQIHRTSSECEASRAFDKCMNTETDKSVCHRKYDSLDTDGNGYPLDCSGWDAVGTGAKDERTGLVGGPQVSDAIGHGTHVSGVIAGTGFIAGVASSAAEILPVRVLGQPAQSLSDSPSDGGSPQPSDPEFLQSGTVADTVARGVLYAIRSHAQVLNLSLGYSIHDDSELMRRMVALAQSKGILVVAAAGNESSRTPVYPCRYPGVVCVASFSADGSISHFSDYGDSVDVAAPGYSILSSWPVGLFPSFFTERKGYDFLSGTSMAAPFVSGALARLLQAGFSPAEAYARLILGTRKSLPPSAMAELEPKFVLSGNLDLARAFSARPQPLVIPALKESVLVPLDRQKVAEPKSASFELALKNVWRDGADIQVRVRIAGGSGSGLLSFGSDGSEVARRFASWKSGETRSIKASLSWSAPIAELPGEFYFEVSVSGPSMDSRAFKKTVEFVVPIRPMALVVPTEDPRLRRINTNLTAQKLGDNYSIKPVTCLPSAGQTPSSRVDHDLLVILKPGNSTILQLLRHDPQSGELRLTGGDVLDNSKEQLVTFSCLDEGLAVAQTGGAPSSRGYVVGSFNAHDKKFTLTYLDSLFRHGRDAPVLSFSTDVVMIPEEFRWLSGLSSAGATDRTLWPAFVARGKKPDSELKGYDPWETRPESVTNPAEARLYYLDPRGLHTIAAPEGYHYVGMLKPTRAQLAQGLAEVLLFRGTDYVVDLEVAELRGKTLGPLHKVEYTIFQRLMGLTSLPMVSAQEASSGTAFVDDGADGKMRLSLLPDRASAGVSESLLAWEIVPSKPGDRLTQVIGIFADDPKQDAQAFSRSRFQLYFQDRASGAVLGTDLKQYDSVTRHLLARVDGRPAVVLPEGQGTSLTTEVLVPRLESHNCENCARLERPASLKTFGVDGCEQIQLKSTGQNGSGGGLVEPLQSLQYFCGDHFVEVLL